MNDPGLGEPIAENANNVEKLFKQKEGEVEEDYQTPSRWWFASTALPLVAGTFGPMATAFSICALAESWGMSIPPNETEEQGDEIPDPKWLLAVNAVSLVFALAANMSLLLNMAQRLSFSVAQPITIVGWYISSFLLVALVAFAPSGLRLPPTNHAFTQAYYYGIMAAAIYFIISSLMVVTVLGAYKGHYPREFKLTISQRTLMLQTISFLVYLLSGAAVFAHVEGWKFLDAVYWADFTLLTVGIGDIVPTTHRGRALLFPYAIGGILILGLVIGSIRSLVLEKGKKRMGVRKVEKERVKILAKLKSENGKVLSPIQAEKSPSSNGSSALELSRRKEEFGLMRKAQDRAVRSSQWVSLFISATAWFALWLLGAVVFMKSERAQSWSYFQSIYFAYTSLLAIGYGDFYPTSNSGKPFFVFWSLLAVPTMTILIGNMGDTIVKWLKDMTLWIGEWTILPGERPVRGIIKKGAARFTGGWWTTNETGAEEIVPGICREPKYHDNRHNTDASSIYLPTQLGPRNNKNLTPSHHSHPRTLLQEIRHVIFHLNIPHHRYSFDEWAYFLYLIGEEESSLTLHRAPQTGREGRRISSDEGGGWSWLGKKSPLVGRKSEPEWVLERLMERLEGVLEGEGGKVGDN
ncbi:MAG: Potassium channel [Geoglossum umbratile]|nr:MAG: Potassium channel [Geoglossum umbratile]